MSSRDECLRLTEQKINNPYNLDVMKNWREIIWRRFVSLALAFDE